LQQPGELLNNVDPTLIRTPESSKQTQGVAADKRRRTEPLGDAGSKFKRALKELSLLSDFPVRPVSVYLEMTCTVAIKHA